MKNFAIAILFFSLLTLSCSEKEETSNGLLIEGLSDEVEIITDQWGVNHIYAQNENDLFFAQGYAAARDRLFQFEVWRRQATGTVAEILGERELNRDIGTRLFKYRGDLDEELNHYHKNGKAIIESYTAGVNAYINETTSNPDLLPMEFGILGIKPQPWTPEVVISRHQGLLGNIGSELRTGRAVTRIGAEKVKELANYEPWEPQLDLDPAIPKELLFEDILELYNAYRRPLIFQPEDVPDSYRMNEVAFLDEPANELELYSWDKSSIGSNNWIVSADKSASGSTLMANDPHRSQAVPSLRYIVHLNAPGWNVIGGGEPEIPGISIGHNEYGAWGLTVFRTDGEDMKVYETNPENPNQYMYNGEWEDMEVISDEIRVKGKDAVKVDHRFTKHGPVVFQKDNYAFAIQCAWLEPGGSPYLASLMMDQASSWEEFREACNYSHIPGENMIWADTEGHIGWQAVGIAPIRENFSGMVPVPGDGSHEWSGYLPIIEKPNVLDPERGFFATANENVVPEDYPDNGTIGYEWSDKYRGQRIAMILDNDDDVTMDEMVALQTDYYSIPASTLVPLLNDIELSDSRVEEAKTKLLSWDFHLNIESIAAGIYVAWEREISRRIAQNNIPEEARGLVRIPMTNTINWITGNDPKFVENREELLSGALLQAVENLTEKLGEDMNQWQYGQEKYKHIQLRHPLSRAVNQDTRDLLEVGPAPRGGYGLTVGASGGNDNQTHGASFRIFVDTGDWDATLAQNNPGQSGDPNSKHYKDLFDSWANDELFPLYFSREKIDTVIDTVTVLKPAK